MRNVLCRDARSTLWSSLLAGVAGFLMSMALLLGILGGYILGAALLFLGVTAAPLIGTVALIRRVMQPDTARAPARAPLPGDSAPSLKAEVEPGRLRIADILQDLSDGDLARVAAIGREVQLSQGALLAKQGEIGSTVYVILDGLAQLTADSARGEITLRIAGPGESLPLAALLGSGKLISTAYAMTDLQAVAIPCDSFQQLCRQQPNIGSSVYRSIADILAGRYQNSLSRLVDSMEQALGQSDVFANV